MIGSIFTSSLGLFAAVTVVYLFTWYSTQDQMASQTVAFFAWLIGHVLLAFNMRSERQPMFQLGLVSNRMMLIWGVAVAAFIVLISLIPGAQHLTRITTPSATQWSMILGATLIGTFWLEIKKMVTYRKSGRYEDDR
jgi:Ca2+-transporting ATPase